MKPRQLITVRDVQYNENGFTVYFHEDFLMGHPLSKEIKKYKFFD